MEARGVSLERILSDGEHKLDYLLSENADPETLERMGTTGPVVVTNGTVAFVDVFCHPVEELSLPYEIVRDGDGLKINGKLLCFRMIVDDYPNDWTNAPVLPPSVRRETPWGDEAVTQYVSQAKHYLFATTGNAHSLEMKTFIDALPCVRETRIVPHTVYRYSEREERMVEERDYRSEPELEIRTYADGDECFTGFWFSEGSLRWPNVREATEQLDEALRQCARVLSDGGIILCRQRAIGIDYRFPGESIQGEIDIYDPLRPSAQTGCEAP